MRTELKIERGNVIPRGVSRYKDGINIALKIPHTKKSGIYLWIEENNRKKKYDIPFGEEYRIGDISCIYIADVAAEKCCYQIYAEEEITDDIYARKIKGREKWGRLQKKQDIFYRIYDTEFPWDQDDILRIPYENSCFYCLHVRGFTKHISSGVQNRGTFLGIIEKIPYLKELGVTALELMPAYEFPELIIPEDKISTMAEAVRQYAVKPTEDKDSLKLNYWGFTKDSHYFMPKSSFAANSAEADREFKIMVKELHKNGIEVVMQFYFENRSPVFILEVLKFWRMEYHVDGFHLKGAPIPEKILAEEELLADTKLLYYSFPYEDLYKDEIPAYRHLASCRDDFMIDMRKYLKGDENMLQAVLGHLRHNSDTHGVIQYITNYEGYTMADLVAYERKHNLENGEENRDGSDFNYSWNCGAEGTSRKKAVLKLRRQQMRNALCLVLLSQASPMLLSGDEFAATRKGNNNPYCLDNEINWLDWRLLEKNKDWFLYVKSLLAFRKEHWVLQGGRVLKLIDMLSCGYPDVSYHGTQAWRPELEVFSRHVGILYSGKYAKKDRKEDNSFFIAYNMHWQKQSLALPRLPKGENWYLLASTKEEQPIPKAEEAIEKTGKTEIEIAPRSIDIYVAK